MQEIKALIEFLGTPRLYAELFRYLKVHGVHSGVFLRRVSDQVWVVEETLGLMPQSYEYSSPQDLMQEFSPLVPVFQSDLFWLGASKQIPPKDSAFVKKVLDIHQALGIPERQETRISQLAYNITGLETLLGNLLFEPIEPLEMMSILTDSIGELLITSSVLYQRQNDHFQQVHIHGDHAMPAAFDANSFNTSPLYFTFPVKLPQKRLFPEFDSENHPDITAYAFPVIEEDQVSFFMILWRTGVFQEEELQLMTTTSRLIAQVVQLNEHKEQIRRVRHHLEANEYHFLSLHKSMEMLFSCQNPSEFSDRMYGILKEVFPNQSIYLYARRDWNNLLWPSQFDKPKFTLILKHSAIWDQYDLSDRPQREAFMEDFGDAQFIEDHIQLSLATILRSPEGTVMGLILSSAMEEENRRFLRSLAMIGGVALHGIFTRRDLQKTVELYGERMDTVQLLHQYMEGWRQSRSLTRFVSTLKADLVREAVLSDICLIGGSPMDYRIIADYPSPECEKILKESMEADLKELTRRGLPNNRLAYLLPVLANGEKSILLFIGEDQPLFHLVVHVLSMVLPYAIVPTLAE